MTNNEDNKLSPEELQRIEERFSQDMQRVTSADTAALLSREPELRQQAERLVGKWELMGRQVLLLVDMLRDWYAGRYPTPWRVIAAITAALLYFVNPFDIIPDVIPGVGYLDDVAVLGLCMRLIRSDLRSYIAAKGLRADEFGL
ncbi:MAG TPA: YkvA family protein [Candidatus Hydrogenedentes bacterium]|nr:YkvA family protein [Candidatus Hydrogenedentota bacterium]HOL77492.1 YkvA family protein [Candidatus Hydrogenedentota bacterium]HPO86261.1 YkvA family protein [Candidatus Hydrogenedentota bacterium]